ncbi:hypothetical protein AAT19DRAFT_11528 [Rhodotorula toruloides]|uniref:Uncharacterized protein n=1 Tax=Rhodotorula toruloides TaxID=5286 RepID=A0A2S9ZX11_RHOTO|nr:hypothetical protein AAT19DRAFT_11528 [Rhodotorula toruloides]
MAIAPITGMLRKHLLTNLSIGIGGGVVAGYAFWSVADAELTYTFLSPPSVADLPLRRTGTASTSPTSATATRGTSHTRRTRRRRSRSRRVSRTANGKFGRLAMDERPFRDLSSFGRLDCRDEDGATSSTWYCSSVDQAGQRRRSLFLRCAFCHSSRLQPRHCRSDRTSDTKDCTERRRSR